MESCDITTPVQVMRLRDMLKDYMLQSYIINGFTFGFRVGAAQSSVLQLKTGGRRHTAVVHLAEHLTSKLNIELQTGRVLGPFDKVPIANLVVSPVYVVEKSISGKYRLIHHLSYPKGNSVNDCIINDMKTVQYCSVIDVASYIHNEVPEHNLYMAKIDLKDAYRCVPVYKADWHLLGMQCKDKYFIDTRLPMGLASSCFIFNVISDAINWMASRSCNAKIFSYLDDFLIVGSGYDATLMSLNNLLRLCNYLGFPVSHNKTEYPAKVMTFLGLGIDSGTHAFYVPSDKRDKIIVMIDSFLCSKKRSVLDFQKLIGKLNFISTALIPGKSLMGSLFEQLRGILSSDGWKKRRVTKNIKLDMSTWKRFLIISASKQFKFLFPNMVPKYQITSDASGSVGFGCISGSKWFQSKWNDKWWSSQNIALLELFPIYVALRTWGEQYKDCAIQVNSDNSAVVSMLSVFYSKDRQINTLLKECAFLVMAHNIVLQPVHIAGADNDLADRLSRFLPCPHLPKSGFVALPCTLSPRSIREELQL